MISQALFFEIVILICTYFNHFGNVLFISYGSTSFNELKYQNLTAELQKQLPEFTVSCGYIKPPDVFLIVMILALEFYFKGLVKLFLKNIEKYTQKTLVVTGLLSLLTLMYLMEKEDIFAISYEGHTIYSEKSSDIDISNVAQLVDIIKENNIGLTFPRGVAVAGFVYVMDTFGPHNRRR